MLLVDTSVWVQHLRGDEPVTRQLLLLAADGEELVTTGPVLMELLAGAGTLTSSRAVDRLVAARRDLRVDADVDFRQAAEIFQAVRRQGRTVRSMVDCLIASVALRHDVPVLHRDADFDAIAASTGMQVLR